MPSLIEGLLSQLGGATAQQIGRQIGADPAKTQTAIAAAVPMLLGALSRNAASPAGASALSGALARDHDGSVLDNLGGYLQAFQTGPGEGILGHVLGATRSTMESNLSKVSGLDLTSVSRLLTVLAPLVMGALGRTQKSQGLDAGSLASLLGHEKQAAAGAVPGMAGLLGLLDRDGDGDVVNDVAKGLGSLGKLFGGR
jgi:hypothetical protein